MLNLIKEKGNANQSWRIPMNQDLVLCFNSKSLVINWKVNQ